jgi:hypothetical protein
MQLNGTTTAQNAHVASPRTRFLRRAIPAALAIGFAAIAVMTLTRTVTANDDGRRGCNNRTLRGDYGILVSGIRGAGPGRTEQFVGTALRTYDGNGGFSQVDNSHGQLTGAQRDVPATGTYEVNADCTGTSLIFFPGAPFPVETAFVIVDRGEEVKDAVMAPPPNLVAAVLRRLGR